MNKAAWQRIYEDWKYWNPDITRSNEKTLVIFGCRGKLAYPEYFMALQAAAKLEATGRRFEGYYIIIYLCEVCQMIHLGNLKHPGSRDVDREYFGGDRVMKKFGQRLEKSA